MFRLETWGKCIDTEEDTRDRHSRRGEGGRRGMERDKENKKEGRGSMEITS